jgi:glycosyltransferase involved in cell wall biosynthesis
VAVQDSAAILVAAGDPPAADAHALIPMRLLHLTPGTGNFHCGSCLRDHALIRALRLRGHDAIMAPLYLPLVTDLDEGAENPPVLVGGISLYLQQKLPWFHRLPRIVHKLLDHPAMLRLAARGMGMTSARDLGEMTLGSLLGREGRQWGEWRRLVEWARDEVKPDAVSLSNSLLCGLAPALAEELNTPVFCSLQGEDAFLDTLPEPWRSQSWGALQAAGRSVTRFIAPSRFYRDAMQPRLGATAEQMTVLPNGLDPVYFEEAEVKPAKNGPPVIGYLARMIHGKGLGLLVDAFIDLNSRNAAPDCVLRIGGAFTPLDEPFVREQKIKLAAAGLAGRVTWHPNLSLAEKLSFLRGLDIFSVPAFYGEAFGLYAAEAMAVGVPVAQPASGAFPELVEATGGGILCEPDSPKALAAAWESLLGDPARRQQLAAAAKAGARKEFSAATMAERFEEILQLKPASCA